MHLYGEVYLLLNIVIPVLHSLMSLVLYYTHQELFVHLDVRAGAIQDDKDLEVLEGLTPLNRVPLGAERGPPPPLGWALDGPPVVSANGVTNTSKDAPNCIRELHGV